VVLADDDAIRRADVERELTRIPGVAPRGTSPTTATSEEALSLDTQRKGTERDALVRALARSGNNRTQAARLLEVSRRTLYNKLKEHGLE
jgi:DNA-binding NtrC family response regulator